MKIKFLGSGSAFVKTKENYHSNILITKSEEVNQFGQPNPYQPEDVDGGVVYIGTEIETRHLLIDAGGHINESLDENGLEATDIDAIFLTHNHSDHNGGLEFIGFKTYFIPPFGSKKPVLFGAVTVLETLWERVLKGNMASLNGKKVNMSEYFNVHTIKPKQSFNFMNTHFTPVRMTHVVDDTDEVPAYGLKWEEDGIKFFFTGDTQFDFWRLMPFWEQADVIFQDCEMMEYPNSVHAQFHQLKQIPEQYKNKMWLYHYMLYGKTYEELEAQVLEAGFAGLVKKGQEFDTQKLKEELKK